jgi:hypothetical protein
LDPQTQTERCASRQLPGKSPGLNSCNINVGQVPQTFSAARLPATNRQTHQEAYQYTCGAILPVALYGYETWSPTLRAEQKLRAFENKAHEKYMNL